jgi:hypothetical protein
MSQSEIKSILGMCKYSFILNELEFVFMLYNIRALLLKEGVDGGWGGGGGGGGGGSENQ